SSDLQVCDPMAEAEEAVHEYGVPLTPIAELKSAAAVVAAVAHKQFLAWTPEDICRQMEKNPVLIDVKGMFDQQAMTAAGVRVWRL
ncbi:MAG: UDP binding domain-containing protein, partial [Desulfuromonadaceae bacterium]|nr:UDP binding domain-containing protein [Desulfuromonadaceae bacterium]